MDRLTTLRNEANEVAERIEALTALDTNTEGDTAAREMELKGLTERAQTLAGKIDFEAKVAESAKSLRSVADRCQPAAEVRASAPARIEPIRYNRRLRAFDSVESAYRCGQWLAGTFLGNAEAKRWCIDNEVESRIMGEATNPLGGFAVPEEFSAAIIRNVESFGVAPSVMQNATMASDTILFPKRLTGVTANWIGENVEIATSDPTGTQVQLVAKKLAVGTRVSNELLSDSVISIADWLVQEFSLELAKRIDEAVFNGTAVSSFGGIHGIVPKIDVAGSKSLVLAATANNAAENLDLRDFSRALAALPRYALGGAAWYMSPAVYHASVERLQLGNTALAGGNSREDIAGGGLPRFLGLPVVQVLVMDSKTDCDPSKVKVLVGDAALAGIYGVRQQVNLRNTVDEYARFDQTAWYATLRVDAVWHSLGDATEAGPMVALKTGATAC
jgi:HK97 family phage major capsid protein